MERLTQMQYALMRTMYEHAKSVIGIPDIDMIVSRTVFRYGFECKACNLDIQKSAKTLAGWIARFVRRNQSRPVSEDDDATTVALRYCKALSEVLNRLIKNIPAYKSCNHTVCVIRQSDINLQSVTGGYSLKYVMCFIVYLHDNWYRKFYLADNFTVTVGNDRFIRLSDKAYLGCTYNSLSVETLDDKPAIMLPEEDIPCVH